MSKKTDHPTIKSKKINDNYYGSPLNKFASENCKTDLVINNIDLIINNYKKGTIKIIESKHDREKLGIGQNILLGKLSKMGIPVFVVYGNPPYEDNSYEIFSYQSGLTKQGTKQQLINFLNS